MYYNLYINKGKGIKVKKNLSQIAGNNVKRIIKESVYKTQEEFAYSFGAEIRTVSRWLNGGIKNLDTLQEISEFLNVDALRLLQET